MAISGLISETVIEVRHWTDNYFSFTTTRDRGFRFDNGQFVMLGLALGGRGQLPHDLGLAPLNPDTDRAMICGGPKMLSDFRELLDAQGFHAAARIGAPGSYVFERAFVEK